MTVTKVDLPPDLVPVVQSYRRDEICGIGAVAALLQGNVGIQRPEWEYPTFWSRPLVRTKARCVSRTSYDWFTFLSVEGIQGHKGVVRWLVLETLNPRETTGIDFRLRWGGSMANMQPSLSPHVNFEDGRVTLCKDPTDTWPLQKIPFFTLLLPTSRLDIQVRNTTYLDQNVYAGFFGWYYEDVDADELGSGRESGGGLLRGR
jgi:hypothetical protein